MDEGVASEGRRNTLCWSSRVGGQRGVLLPWTVLLVVDLKE